MSIEPRETAAEIWLATLGAMATSACLMAGNYHSARLLDEGTSAVGATISTTSYSFDDGNGGVERVAYYNVMPEIAVHTGVSDKLEFGGRVGIAQLALEGDLKYRFVQSNGLHVTVGPGLGVKRRPEISGLIVRLPIIATYEFSDSFAVVGAVFANSSHYSLRDGVPDGRTHDWQVFDGSWLTLGGTMGIEVSHGRFGVHTGIEREHYSVRLAGAEREPFATTSFFVHAKFLYER